MGYSYNRRVKVGNNTYLNIRTNGVSTTVRSNGMSYTTGPKGSYVSTGIPGTGIRYRQKVGGRGNGSPSIWVVLTFVFIVVGAALFFQSDLFNMTTFSILAAAFIVFLILYIFISKLNYKKKIKQCAAELEEALDQELSETKANAEAVVASIRAKIDSEPDPLKRMVYQAFVDNYPRIQLYNLFVARKSGFESRPDFNLDFVQEYYSQNNELISEYSDFKSFDLLPHISKETEMLYNNLSAAYENLGVSMYLRGFSSAIELKPSSFFYLKVGDTAIPTFKDFFNNTVLIYPTFAVTYKGGNDITITDLKAEKSYDRVHISTQSEEHTEHDTSVRIPYDAEILGYEWKYMTKKGEPDARYSDNPKYTRFKRCQVFLHPLSCILYTTSFKSAYNLEKALSDLVEGDVKKAMSRILDANEIENTDDNPTAQTYDPAVILRQYINEDRAFLDIVRYVVNQKQIATSTLQRQFSIGYNRAGKYLDQLESLGFVSIPVGMKRDVKVDEDFLNCLLEDDSQPQPTQKGKHKVGDKHPTKPWVWTEYAPGKFDWRKDKSVQGNGSPEEKSAPMPKVNSKATSKLNSLIGLKSVKEEIAKLQNFIKIQLVRQSQGLKTSPISYHCVFTGNPGTGKTTVARIVAEIYRDLGILKKGHLIETDRSGLVAEYIGQTAVKTNKVIDSALDGVLFIDEAYSLAPSSSSDFGHEAIATLLKRMEDDRDRLIVILAGYGNEMQTFIDANPGLQSRFNRYIHFDDYSSDDLLAIFELNLKKHQYVITDSAKALLKKYLDNAVANKDKNFGNGRFVRNMFEKTLQLQATRLAELQNLSKEDLQLIVDEDIPTT